MKPENMKSVTRTRTSPDQQGDRNLSSDGMANGSSQGHTKNRFAGNQHGGAAEGNFGRGPTVGNNGTSSEGPKRPPTAKLVDAWKSGSKSLYAGTYSGADQVRTPGGTRRFEPSATQNYSGDIDRINEGRGPTKGNQQ